MTHFKLSNRCDKLAKDTNLCRVPSFGHEWQKAEELIQGLPDKLDRLYTVQGEFQQTDADDIHRINVLLDEVNSLLDRIHDRH